MIRKNKKDLVPEYNEGGNIHPFLQHIEPEEKPAPLKESQSNISVVGYKAIEPGSLVFHKGCYYFWITGRSAYVATESWAECNISTGRYYRPPLGKHLDNCTCGFYAWKTKENAQLYIANSIQLEVELFGRVIVHENGYRAEKQRVLSVSLPKRCFLCANESTRFGYAYDPFTEKIEVQNSYSVQYTTGNSLIFLCDDHIFIKNPNVDRNHLEKLLDTKVNWI